MAKFEQETYTTVVLDSTELMTVATALSALVTHSRFDIDRQNAKALVADFNNFLDQED